MIVTATTLASSQVDTNNANAARGVCALERSSFIMAIVNSQQPCCS